MTRTSIPLALPDISGFARALGKGLAAHHAEHGTPPSHQSLLNLIARAAGHRNLQALHAAPRASAALPRLARPADDRPAPLPLTPNARKALSQFDIRGRLVRWPHKYSVQRLAMWVLWMQFDGRRVYTEREVNEILKVWHTWGDHVTLRRELINDRLLTRKSDCSEYRKLPARPDDEARALLAAWRALVPKGRVIRPGTQAVAGPA